jgi:hypothetical protein
LLQRWLFVSKRIIPDLVTNASGILSNGRELPTYA